MIRTFLYIQLDYYNFKNAIFYYNHNKHQAVIHVDKGYLNKNTYTYILIPH